MDFCGNRNDYFDFFLETLACTRNCLAAAKFHNKKVQLSVASNLQYFRHLLSSLQILKNRLFVKASECSYVRMFDVRLFKYFLKDFLKCFRIFVFFQIDTRKNTNYRQIQHPSTQPERRGWVLYSFRELLTHHTCLRIDALCFKLR